VSTVRKFRVKTRLANMIREPGGIHVSEALKRGEAMIAAQTEVCLDQIDVCLENIQVLFADPSHDPEQMYRLSTDIINLCAVLTYPALAEVALSLCELIDQAGEGARPKRQAVQVHIASMKLLHRTGLDEAASQEILDSLHKMVTKLDR